MSALTADRDTQRRDGEQRIIPVASGVKIFAGSMVCYNATGYAAPAADTANFKFAGFAEEYVDNSGGSDGDVNVRVRRGVFEVVTSGAAITDIGKPVFASDDQTVAMSGTSNGVFVGRIFAFVSATSVYVDTREMRACLEQADSTASDVAGLKSDFNDLLAKLRAAHLMAAS